MLLPRPGAPPFPTSSPLLWPSRSPCPRACLSLSPPGPHPETGKPRHRLARPRARGHTGSPLRPLPSHWPRGWGPDPGGLGFLRRFRPEARTWARAATWWCPEVGLRFSSGLGAPTPRSTSRAGGPRKSPDAGIQRRARVPGPGGAGSNGQDGEVSMMRREMKARPGCPVLTLSRLPSVCDSL